MERGTEAQKKGTLSILMQFQYGQGKDKEGFLTNGSRFRSRAIVCSKNLKGMENYSFKTNLEEHRWRQLGAEKRLRQNRGYP